MTATPRRRHPEYVSEFDNAMWVLEKDPQLRSTITVMLLLDRVPDRSLVTERVERLSRIVPGLRHRLVSSPLGLATPRWVVDPDFDLSYHLRWIGAPQPKTLDTVIEYARQSAMSGFDKERPPWTITMVDGVEGDRAVVINKMHHILADGPGFLQIAAVLLDRDREPGDPGPMPPVPVGGGLSMPELTRDELEQVRDELFEFALETSVAMVRAVPYVLRHPVPAAKAVVRNVTALGRIVTPRTRTLSPIMLERHGWWRYANFDVDFAAFKRTAKNCGATINDAFMAAAGTGLARYHKAHGAAVEELRAAVSINVRRPEDPPFGNHINGGFVVLPVSTWASAELMAEYHELVAQAREDARQPLANALGVVLGRVGTALAGPIMKHTDVVLTNIPGPDIAYFCGVKIQEVFGWGPTFGAGINVTVVSYGDKFCVNVNADAGAVPDIDVLVDCLKQGFDQVLTLA